MVYKMIFNTISPLPNKKKKRAINMLIFHPPSYHVPAKSRMPPEGGLNGVQSSKCGSGDPFNKSWLGTTRYVGRIMQVDFVVIMMLKLVVIVLGCSLSHATAGRFETARQCISKWNSAVDRQIVSPLRLRLGSKMMEACIQCSSIGRLF